MIIRFLTGISSQYPLTHMTHPYPCGDGWTIGVGWGTVGGDNAVDMGVT